MNFSRRFLTNSAICGLVTFTAISSEAVTIAGVNFDGRSRTTTTTTNDTASNLIWTTSGVADPGDLTAVPDQALPNGFGQFQANGLFQTPNTQNAFVPDLNVHNEGSYYLDVPLNVTNAGGISLTGMTFTGLITNNAGSFQGVGREVDYRAEVLAPGDVVIAADNTNGQNAFMQNLPPVPTTTVNLDFGGVNLNSGTTYNVRLYVGTDNNLVGNNAGVDNIDITGDLIPEPSISLFGVLAGFLFLRRRR